LITEIKNGMVYEVQNLEDGGKALGARGNATKVILSGNNYGVINQVIPIAVQYYDWQDNILTNLSDEITITVANDGVVLEVTLTPVNGQTEIDFISEVAGTFEITARSDFPCDTGRIEVTVSE